MVAALALAASPAAAHVTNDNAEVPAGSFADDHPDRAPRLRGSADDARSPSRSPRGSTNVAPQVHPGWHDRGRDRDARRTDRHGRHGEPITERTSVVTFTAEPGNELPDGFRDQFTLGYRAPDAAGEFLFFKTIQTCTGGLETAWIEEYTGEGEEPEHPSPAVLLTEATGEGHEEAGGEEAEGEEPAATISAEPVSETSDDSSDGLAIAALVVGVIGLALGGAAFVVTRRS